MQRHRDTLNPNQMDLLQTGRLISASKQDNLAATVKEKTMSALNFHLCDKYDHYTTLK